METLKNIGVIMMKNIIRIEFAIVDKVYHFMCDSDSPIEHIKEALFQCQKYIGAVEDQLRAQMAAKAAEQAPVQAQEQVSEAPAQAANGFITEV